MSTYKARREPRVNVSLDVIVQTLQGEKSFRTRNASYAGVFVVCEEPLPLRKLVRFKTRLPESDQDLQMMGLVAHTVNAAADAAELGRLPGMGIQLFSLGEETRQVWRDYIGKTYEQMPEALRGGDDDRPRVRVRIPNEQMLEKFYDHDLPAGSIFLRTADLHPQGTAVYCDIVHPNTAQIFVLEALIDEVVPTPIRERGIRLSLTPPEDISLLRRFIDGEDAP